MGFRFSKLFEKSIEERLEIVGKELSEEEKSMLKEGSLPLEVADKMIENVVGKYSLPLGIADNFVINGKKVYIPMAIEEPSVVAAASKAALLALPHGFKAYSTDSVMIGEIAVMVKEWKEAERKINEEKIREEAEKLASHMKRYGGGFVGFEYRGVSTARGDMIIFYFYIDVADSQGANTINTFLESISPLIEEMLEGEARMRIISNLAVKRMVFAKAEWKAETLGKDATRKYEIDEEERIKVGWQIVEKILDAYEFARIDVFRAVTHNKGIMNGVDAVALATGQDWRAIEAGAHGFASLNGYKPLTTYRKTRKGIEGIIAIPIQVGTVGGTIKNHPIAKISLKILGVKKARELAEIMACVGLANNFAALRALVTTGIQKGHMKLHARTVAIAAGAKNEEIEKVAEIMLKEKNFSVEFAKKILEEMRK